MEWSTFFYYTVEGGARRGTTALFHSEIQTRLYRGVCKGVLIGVPYPRVQHVHAEENRTGLHNTKHAAITQILPVAGPSWKKMLRICEHSMKM
jgi:hypothetical protein